MADASKTIDLIFNGIDRTGAATQAALRNLESFAGSTRDLTQPVADFTLGAVKLEAGLLAAGAAMTVFAVKTAGDFDTAFRQISTLFDASDADLAAFRTSVQEYAAQSGKSMQDVMAALSAAIGSGVDYKDSLGLITTAEQLAIATKADLKGTTEVLVSTMNAYGISTQDAGVLADQMFQIIKDGKIEMSDLSQSLAMVTPVAAAAGVGFEEVGAAVAVLTAAGMQPSQAIEYLRSAISNIIKPSEQATKLAKELGIGFDANALKSRGLAAVLADVATATGGSADKMARLFGDVGGLSAVMTLTGPQAQKFGETIAAMGSSAGNVATAYGKMAGDVDGSIQRVVNAFTGLMVQMGTPLLDEFAGVADAVARIFTALGASVKDGGLKDLVAYVEGLFGDLQATLERVAQNLPAALAQADLSGFKGGIEAVANAFGSLFANVDLTTVDGLTRAIELAGTAFLGLSKFTAGVVESFKPLFDYLVGLAEKADGVDMGVVKLAGNISGFVTQMNAVAGVLPGVLDWFETLLALLTVRQGLGLVGGIAQMAGALPGLAAGLTTAGMAMAAYFASDRVVALVQALVEWKQANDQVAASQEQAAAIQERAIPTLERFRDTTGFAVKSIDEAMQLVDSGKVVWDAAVDGWVDATTAQQHLADAAKETVNPFEAQNQALINSVKGSKDAALVAAELRYAQAGLLEEGVRVVPVFDAATGAITGYERQLVAATDPINQAAQAVKKQADEAEKAAEKAQQFRLEMEKLASNERIKTIEAKVNLDIANVQANAQIAQAAFESINTGIQSTGQLIGDLFKQLSNPNLSFQTEWDLQDQIEQENQRRQQEFDLQKQLTEAQIENMKLQNESMSKGEGLIKIDGSGLKPHLEAFMWEILKEIQVRASKDGLKMLLGV